MSIVVYLFAGWLLLIGITFAIQKSHYSLYTGALVPPAQIFATAIGDTGAKLLLLIAIGAQLFCGMSSVTANSRMIYAFSRDGALPGSGVWHKVNKRTRTPTNAIWLAAVGALILGLPYLWNGAAYAAVTSIATIGLYIAYVSPTFLRLRQGSSFQRGPWHLGDLHHDPVHAAHREPDRLGQLQLHDRGRAGRDRLRRDLLAGVRAQLVHRAEGAGHAGGAGGHRAGALHMITVGPGLPA